MAPLPPLPSSLVCTWQLAGLLGGLLRNVTESFKMLSGAAPADRNGLVKDRSKQIASAPCCMHGE